VAGFVRSGAKPALILLGFSAQATQLPAHVRVGFSLDLGAIVFSLTERRGFGFQEGAIVSYFCRRSLVTNLCSKPKSFISR
jgi:hypothetical protein